MEANNSLVYVHARPHVASLASIFYVGKGSDSRSTLFSRRNPHHMNIIRKYGSKNIQVGKMQCSSESIAFSLERGLIKCLRRSGVNLVNMTRGIHSAILISAGP